MRRILVMTVLIFSAYTATAQKPQLPAPPAPATKPAGPPVLSDQFKSEFYKAQLDMEHAQSNMEAARQEYGKMVEDFRAACKDSVPNVTQALVPECVPAPPAPTKPIPPTLPLPLKKEPPAKK